jgi:AAA domain, putative AbiEii toxin, Type IV TA system/AAA ATPase domain
MLIRTVEIANFRSIKNSGPVNLGPITVLVGPNNSGKSSFIHALYQIQLGAPPPAGYVRKGEDNWRVTITADLPDGDRFGAEFSQSRVSIELHYRSTPASELFIELKGGPSRSMVLRPMPQEEAHAYVVPVLAKRKVATFQRTVDKGTAGTIRADWSYLPARLSKIGNQDFPGSSVYRNACTELLGFVVTQFPSDNGIQAGRYIDADTTIELEAMGEGVTSLAGILAELATAKNKLFLIEEPENDLHPTALKALLELIIESSKNNQFIVSTHSAIVLRFLGASKEAEILKVNLSTDTLPTSSYTPVPPNPESRLAVLRELGYELSDFDLYDVWLILEEASAERLVKQYFLKWFTPRLVGRLRTVAAQGTGDVAPKFRDLERLCLFGHLEDSYKDRIWVLCDGDASGVEAINKLRKTYGSWKEDRFGLLEHDAFELYYPPRFSEKVKSALAKTGLSQREAKRELLLSVLEFIDEDEPRAKTEFELSAREFRNLLLKIESELLGNP